MRSKLKAITKQFIDSTAYLAFVAVLFFIACGFEQSLFDSFLTKFN